MSKEYSTQSTKDLSDEETNHHSKRLFFIQLTITIIYAFIKIALIIAVMALVTSTRLNQFKNSNSYLRCQQNLWLWEQQIIIDFRLVKGYNCPQQYQQYTNYSWPGNIEGCFCKMSVGLFQYEVVMQGRCSQREFSAGCLSVPSNSQVPFQFWQSEAHLCIKRLKNYNFYANHANIVNPQGYAIKNCSLSTHYQIDLIDQIPCPVTIIVNDSSLNQTIADLNFSFSRQGQYPIVYFRLSEHDFCEGFNDYDISPGRKANYILQKKYKYECNIFDSRTMLITSQGQEQIYRNNPRINYIISTLPSYPQLSNDFIYKLGFVRYPAWTYLCRNSNSYNLLLAKRYISLQNIEYTFNMLVMLAAVSSFTGFTFIIYYLVKVYLYLKAKDMHGYLYLKDYQIKKVNPHTNIVKDKQTEIIKSLIFQFSPIMSIIFLTLLYNNLSQDKTWFQNTHNCTQGSFIRYLQSYAKFIGEQMVIIITSIFLNLTLVCLDIAYLLWRHFKGDLEQQDQHDQPMHSISKTTDQQVSIVNDVGFSKQIANTVVNTEQCLIQNTYNYYGDSRRINIINIDDDDQILEEEDRSEYSQSSKKSD